MNGTGKAGKRIGRAMPEKGRQVVTQSGIRITQMGVAILVALSVGAPWAFSSEDCDLCEEAFEMEAEECMDNYDTSHCDAEENLARRYQ